MSTRSSQKQKPPYVVPVQKEYVSKYVHNNHPDNFPQKDTLDFSTFSADELREYRGFLLESSEVGKRTESESVNEQRKQDNNLYDYRTKDDLVHNVEDHFKNQMTVKESEVIMDFVYKVRKEDDKFRLHFDR